MVSSVFPHEWQGISIVFTNASINICGTYDWQLFGGFKSKWESVEQGDHVSWLKDWSLFSYLMVYLLFFI